MALHIHIFIHTLININIRNLIHGNRVQRVDLKPLLYQDQDLELEGQLRRYDLLRLFRILGLMILGRVWDWV